MVSDIPEDKWDKIEAVCHKGTGRLQSVREEWNTGYYNLIKKFDQATGVPVLLNTSYNLRGEPIVTTPREAINTFAASDIDLLVEALSGQKPEGCKPLAPSVQSRIKRRLEGWRWKMAASILPIFLTVCGY
jgi:hypothetical protein